MTDWNNLKPPVAPVDGWGTGWRAPGTQTVTKPAVTDGWGNNARLQPMDTEAKRIQNWVETYVEPDLQTPHNLAELENYEKQLTEAIWTANALDSAQTKASVVNSLAGTKDAFNVDQDGELTRMKEITTGEQPLGYYIAYSDGKWLHVILSGPYSTDLAVDAWGDAAYELMTNDAAFKLAFNNTFDRSGIYLAQIPLSAKRHGAYGVLS